MVRVALCQANLSVGDIDGNIERIRERISSASELGVDLVVFPELSVTGYPPEDLLLRPRFIERANHAVHALAADIKNIVVLVGFPSLSGNLYNAAATLSEGKVAAIYHKRHLPNYAVFDEQRYFTSGSTAVVLQLNGLGIGISICEDLWQLGGPAEWAAREGGAQLIVNLSASPYHHAKGHEREQMFATRCADYNCYLAFCNAVGGQDELVFDGHSLVIDPRGNVLARGKQFEEDLVIADIDPVADQTTQIQSNRVTQVDVFQDQTPKPPFVQREPRTPLEPEAEVYHALVLGTADYFRKNGFQHAVLGLSGGIDSALSLLVAVDALGPESVTAISLPSRYTATMNREDATDLTERLGVRLLEIPINALVKGYESALANPFADTAQGVAEENLQARIRGNIIMALSNKFDWLVLTTGNKSEMSVGYATLYGDMAGGFSILKDVFKTWVYRLSQWKNRGAEIMPQRIIDKLPSAELSENQLDTDNLPPYDVLDKILAAYVEDNRSPTEIETLGFDRALVKRIINLVDRAEYKRRQAPPGIRISTRAFGKDRRLPITNQYRND
jgi:NAD+ synthase (glutamine-hydrolysing)